MGSKSKQDLILIHEVVERSDRASRMVLDFKALTFHETSQHQTDCLPIWLRIFVNPSTYRKVTTSALICRIPRVRRRSSAAVKLAAQRSKVDYRGIGGPVTKSTEAGNRLPGDDSDTNCCGCSPGPTVAGRVPPDAAGAARHPW